MCGHGSIVSVLLGCLSSVVFCLHFSPFMFNYKLSESTWIAKPHPHKNQFLFKEKIIQFIQCTKFKLDDQKIIAYSFRTKAINYRKYVSTQQKKCPKDSICPSRVPRKYNVSYIAVTFSMANDSLTHSKMVVVFFFLWPNFTNGICSFPFNFAFPSASSLIILYCSPANNSNIPKCQMRMVYNFLPHSTAIQLNQCANESILQQNTYHVCTCFDL